MQESTIPAEIPHREKPIINWIRRVFRFDSRSGQPSQMEDGSTRITHVDNLLQQIEFRSDQVAEKLVDKITESRLNFNNFLIINYVVAAMILDSLPGSEINIDEYNPRIIQGGDLYQKLTDKTEQLRYIRLAQEFIWTINLDVCQGQVLTATLDAADIFSGSSLPYSDNNDELALDLEYMYITWDKVWGKMMSTNTRDYWLDQTFN